MTCAGDAAWRSSASWSLAPTAARALRARGADRRPVRSSRAVRIDQCPTSTTSTSLVASRKNSGIPATRTPNPSKAIRRTNRQATDQRNSHTWPDGVAGHAVARRRVRRRCGSRRRDRPLASSRSGCGPAPAPPPAQEDPDLPPYSVDLTQDQHTKIKAILDAQRPKVDTVMNTVLPRLRSAERFHVRADSRSPTPDQQVQFDRDRPRRDLECRVRADAGGAKMAEVRHRDARHRLRAMVVVHHRLRDGRGAHGRGESASATADGRAAARRARSATAAATGLNPRGAVIPR